MANGDCAIVSTVVWGHAGRTIPLAPPEEKDWRWATALAIIRLRRRPELIDGTFDAYKSVSSWFKMFEFEKIWGL